MKNDQGEDAVNGLDEAVQKIDVIATVIFTFIMWKVYLVSMIKFLVMTIICSKTSHSIFIKNSMLSVLEFLVATQSHLLAPLCSAITWNAPFLPLSQHAMYSFNGDWLSTWKIPWLWKHLSKFIIYSRVSLASCVIHHKYN